MAYVWVDGRALEPIGDSLDLWLAFLRDRGAREAWLDVSNGEEVLRIARDGAGEAWRTVWGGGIYTLNGAEDGVEPGRAPVPGPDLAAASERLRSAVESELLGANADVHRAALERALAILSSGGGGEELSDVAWPYFILPDGAPRAARRLIAAACAAWPDAAPVPDPAATPVRGVEAVEAALAAIAAAVNSAGATEPVE